MRCGDAEASSQTSLGAAEAQRKKQLASYEDEVKEMEAAQTSLQRLWSDSRLDMTGVAYWSERCLAHSEEQSFLPLNLGTLTGTCGRLRFSCPSTILPSGIGCEAGCIGAGEEAPAEAFQHLESRAFGTHKRLHIAVFWSVPVFSRMGVVTPRQRKLMLAMTSKRLDVDAAVEGSPATGRGRNREAHEAPRALFGACAQPSSAGEVVGVLSSMKDRPRLSTTEVPQPSSAGHLRAESEPNAGRGG